MKDLEVLLDTNACLRYLLCDIEAQATKAAEHIEQGAEVSLEVMCECVYVLDGVYNVKRDEICKTLAAFLDEVTCTRSKIAKTALEFFAKRNLDFVDCILLAEKHINNRVILTFDKKLNKELNKL